MESQSFRPVAAWSLLLMTLFLASMFAGTTAYDARLILNKSGGSWRIHGIWPKTVNPDLSAVKGLADVAKPPPKFGDLKSMVFSWPHTELTVTDYLAGSAHMKMTYGPKAGKTNVGNTIVLPTQEQVDATPARWVRNVKTGADLGKLANSAVRDFVKEFEATDPNKAALQAHIATLAQPIKDHWLPTTSKVISSLPEHEWYNHGFFLGTVNHVDYFTHAFDFYHAHKDRCDSAPVQANDKDTSINTNEAFIATNKECCIPLWYTSTGGLTATNPSAPTNVVTTTAATTTAATTTAATTGTTAATTTTPTASPTLQPTPVSVNPSTTSTTSQGNSANPLPPPVLVPSTSTSSNGGAGGNPPATTTTTTNTGAFVESASAPVTAADLRRRLGLSRSRSLSNAHAHAAHGAPATSVVHASVLAPAPAF